MSEQNPISLDDLKNKTDYQHDGRNESIDQSALVLKLAEMINSGDYFQQLKSHIDTCTSLKKASANLDAATSVFWKNLETLKSQSEKFEDDAKKASSRVRDSQQKMFDVFKKFDQTFNLTRLQQQVELLERAADAMERLNALNQSGKLDKILNAVRG